LTLPWPDATKKTCEMNYEILLSHSSIERNALSKFCLIFLILLGAGRGAVQANEILANAQISGVPLGKGRYAYTLTLNNTATSTSDIQLFWFGWEAGQGDFLRSAPTLVQTPPGWNATVDGGGGNDGYSIQFNTFTTPLTPGSSLTFTFASPDSPKIMGGPASIYPEYPTLGSQVYSAHDADGLQELFIVQLVEPPLLTIGQTNNQLAFSWTTNYGNFVLQTTTNLFSPMTWTTVTNIPSVLGGTNSLSLPLTNTCQFFRLRSQ
jgi:hypothetical protein